MSTHDAIIIGAGHNGLIAANYLADAGLRVLVLERRELIGGATVTEEVIPGFRASVCSYVSGLLHPKVLADLDLRSHGLDLYQTDMGSANLLRDGRHLFLPRELGAALRDIERVAPGESEGFARFGLRLERFARLTGPWLLSSDPPTIGEVLARFEETGDQELFTEFFTLSIDDLLERYVSSDIVAGLMTFLAMVSVWGSPRTPGWSYVYGHHAVGEYDGHMGQFAFPRGGMGAIAGAIAARAAAKGVRIETASPVARVTVDGGRATGVVLEDGRELQAATVLSNADPRRTYLGMVDEADLPDDFVAGIRRFDMRGSMARVFYALDGLPQFVGRPAGEGPEHRGLTLLGAEVERFERVWDAQRYGRIPDDPPIEFIVQTVHDPTLAPAGKHLLTTGIQQLPFELESGSWDDHRDAFTRRVTETMESYAPGFTNLVTATHTVTPLDLEREYGLTGGNIFHGAMTMGQLYEGRPVPGYGSYRSPIPGLYLCGAGTHPGGGVMGAPGHNGAHAVLADRAAGGYRRSARPSTGGGALREPLVERLMQRPAVRRAALRAARQPALAPLVDRMSRRRS